MTAQSMKGILEQSPEAPVLLDPRDHMGAARAMVLAAFTDRKQRRTLHRHRGSFYEWSGVLYREINDEGISARAWGFLDGALKLDAEGKPQPFKPNRTSVANLVEALKSVCQIDSHRDPPFWLVDEVSQPPPRETFACGNGLLHVPSGKLLPATPNYFSLSASDVPFNPTASEPKLWHQFLGQLHDTDAEAIETEQELFGYALTPDTSLQKIALWYGPKRGGKGTIARVLTAMVGRDSVAAPTIASLSTNFGLWPLIGRNLAIISDARLGAKTDRAAITERLLSISGEDQLTIDRKFKEPWTGRVGARIYIFTNIMPSLSDGSGALASRYVITALTQTFYGREDPKLTDKLVKELPGILNWAIAGYRRLYERGYFIQPQSAMEVVEAIELLGSPVKAFLNDCCEVRAGSRVTVDVLYAAWIAWCRIKGREPNSEQWFGRDLHSAVPGLKTSRPRENGERQRVYEGIALISGTVEELKKDAAEAAGDDAVQAIRDSEVL